MQSFGLFTSTGSFDIVDGTITLGAELYQPDARTGKEFWNKGLKEVLSA